MRATTKHLKSEIRGPGVALFVVEHDADNPEGQWLTAHEIGWYSYDDVFFIREALHDEFAAPSPPLTRHDLNRLRDLIREMKDKHAAIGHQQIN